MKTSQVFRLNNSFNHLILLLMLVALSACGGGGDGGGGDTNQSPVASITQITGPASPGLLAYYPFSGNANDKSGNGNDGTVNGATLTQDRFGNSNSAYSFDGNDQIDVPDSPSLTMGVDQFTISAWAQFSTFGADGGYYLMGHSNGPGNTSKWIFWLSNSGISLVLSSSGGGWIGIGSFPFEIGQWYHVAVQRKGSLLTAFVNGTPIGSATTSVPTPDLSTPFRMGTAELDRPNRFVRGLIDEVRLYDRALSNVELTELYATGRTVFRSTDTITLSGTGADTEDGTLTGASLVWTSNVDGQLGTGNTVSTGLSAGTHTITLTVTDSLGAIAITTDTVTVHEPPTTSIVSPTDGAIFTTTDTIAFTGSATDLEDGPLTGASLVWSSSIDGQLGEGESITSNLSAGTHTITLTATDSNGASGTSNIGITITNSTQTIILSENFESGILDYRISVESIGAFNSASGIIDTTAFGSVRAFGYGR